MYCLLIDFNKLTDKLTGIRHGYNLNLSLFYLVLVLVLGTRSQEIDLGPWKTSFLSTLKVSITSYAERTWEGRTGNAAVEIPGGLVRGHIFFRCYQSRLKDTEQLNMKLGDDESQELTKNIEHLKEKLNRAESLIFSMETPEAIRQRGPTRHPPASEASTEQCWGVAGHRTDPSSNTHRFEYLTY
jgi:hypothetical protein